MKAITREEKLLKALVEGKAPDNVRKVTRTEKLLAGMAVQALENNVQADLTQTDDTQADFVKGKPAGVPGQVWGFDEKGLPVAVDLEETGTLYVTLTAKEGVANRYTADKTKAEIEAAHNAGRAVYCVLDGIMLPLNNLNYTTWAGGVSLVDVIFVGFVGATFCSIDMMDHTNVALEKYGFAVALGGTPIVFSTHPANATGKLFYADSNGMLAPLAVDNFSGLMIENGKLSIGAMSRVILYDELANKNYRLNVQNGQLTLTDIENNTQTEAAICGCTVCGNVNCGEE